MRIDFTPAMLRRLLALLLLLIVVAVPAAAGATTVRAFTHEDCEEPPACRYWTRLLFWADRGARNVVAVRVGERGVVIRDRGAPIPALAPCGGLDSRAVSCPVHAPGGEWRSPDMFVDTADGDDRLVVSRRRASVALWLEAELGTGDDIGSLGLPGRLDGGSGDDRLSVGGVATRETGFLDGGAGDDVLTSHEGVDVLDGGAGDDGLRGGSGDDNLTPGAGIDRVRGGPGIDWLQYTGVGAVRVDLRAGRATSPRGRVRLESVENVFAGAGDDLLVGDARANTLAGGGGRNVILAGAGDDDLQGIARGSACGRGRDIVRVPSVDDPVA